MNDKWTARFINLAEHVAGWSRDPSSKVGAVIVRPDRSIASVGFNGFARGVQDLPFRLNDRVTKLQYTVHAELNAILTAHEPLKNYAIYVWPFQPCAQCAASIIQAGIKNVFYPALCRKNADPSTDPKDMSTDRWADSFFAARTMFREAGVVLHMLG